jgi:hypothetical protein
MAEDASQSILATGNRRFSHVVLFELVPRRNSDFVSAIKCADHSKLDTFALIERSKKVERRLQTVQLDLGHGKGRRAYFVVARVEQGESDDVGPQQT